MGNPLLGPLHVFQSKYKILIYLLNEIYFLMWECFWLDWRIVVEGFEFKVTGFDTDLNWSPVLINGKINIGSFLAQ